MNEYIVSRWLIKEQYLPYCESIPTYPMDVNTPVTIDRRLFDQRDGLRFWCYSYYGSAHLVPDYCIQNPPLPAPEWRENESRISDLIFKARAEKESMRYVKAFETAIAAWKLLQTHTDKDIERRTSNARNTRFHIRVLIRTLKPLVRKEIEVRDLQSQHARLLELVRLYMRDGVDMNPVDYNELIDLTRGEQ